MKWAARALLVSLVALGFAMTDGVAKQPSAGETRADLAWQRYVAAIHTLAALSDTSGGLTDGAAADVHDLARQLEAAMVSAAQQGVTAEPGGPEDATAGWYAMLPADRQLALHASEVQRLSAAVAAIQSRIAAKQRALQLASQASDLLGQAEWQGTQQPNDESAVAAASAAAHHAHTDADLAAAIQELEPLVARLAKEANSEPPQPSANGPCLTGAPPKLIWIHEVPQELIAYENGCPVLATLVTTGRPALPTFPGTYHIFYKARWYLMHSPWPYGSPYWYPDTWVADAMEFIGNGSFIHTADWEPPSAFGKGSEYGAYASHGCVHVMDGPAATLFAWAPIGTEVIVGP